MNVKESSKIKDLKELREKIKGLNFVKTLRFLKLL